MSTQTSQLPQLNDLKTIPAENVQEFSERGHTLVTGILSADEIAVYRPVIVEAAERYNTEKRKMEERDTVIERLRLLPNRWMGIFPVARLESNSKPSE